MSAAESLVGRQNESAQLSRLLSEDTERAVVVSGEAGVGKTALIGQLSASAVADGWRVVQVPAWSSGTVRLLFRYAAAIRVRRFQRCPW